MGNATLKGRTKLHAAGGVAGARTAAAVVFAWTLAASAHTPREVATSTAALAVGDEDTGALDGFQAVETNAGEPDQEGDDLAKQPEDEEEMCVAYLPECLDAMKIDGNEQESVAQSVLENWLTRLFAGDSNAAIRFAALERLLALAKRAIANSPAIALGVAQVLHSFFYWGSDSSSAGSLTSGPSVRVARSSLHLHELAVEHAGCDAHETPVDVFLRRQCPWRWRFVLLVGVELGRQLGVANRALSESAAMLRRVSGHLKRLHELPFFREYGGAAAVPPAGLLGLDPTRLNQNWDFFPTSQHWPIWPQEKLPSFVHFLEANYETFRGSLEALLQEDPDGELFRQAALRQSALTPRSQDWSRLKLIRSGGTSELCDLPFVKPSCDLLIERPEINGFCGSYLAGASLARLMPGSEMKQHFGTHPRLTVHLGLRTPVGASLTVGGQEKKWREGSALLFDDTYAHKVIHRGHEARYVLVAWFCHPCDLAWRQKMGEAWLEEHPLPEFCGGGGGAPPVPGYGGTSL